MTAIFESDAARCVGCGACVRDCAFKALRQDEFGHCLCIAAHHKCTIIVNAYYPVQDAPVGSAKIQQDVSSVIGDGGFRQYYGSFFVAQKRHHAAACNQ